MSVQQILLGIKGGQPPVNTALPTISGSTVRGSNLNCDPGTWTGDVTITYTYQWKRNGSNISGATSATYASTASDTGTTLSCMVTATNSAGSANATSASTATITPAWTFTNRITSADYPTDVACSDNGNILLVAMNGSPLQLSTDGGVTWVNKVDAYSWISCCMSSDGTKMYAVTNKLNEYSFGHIFRSTDGGNTWSEYAYMNEDWQVIRCSGNGAYVWMSCYNPDEQNSLMFISSNYGANWDYSGALGGWNSEQQRYETVTNAAISVSGNYIYVSSGSTLHKSSDYGASYSQVNSSYGGAIWCSDDGSEVWASNDNKVMRSIDYGANWSIHTAMSNGNFIALAVGTDGFFIAQNFFGLSFWTYSGRATTGVGYVSTVDCSTNGRKVIFGSTANNTGYVYTGIYE